MEELIIEAGRTEKHYWRDLWRYRELFYFLAWRDIIVRYKQTVVGVLWVLIRPFLTMLVFTVIFGKLAKMPSNGVPYPILIFAALLPWQLFASAFSGSSASLVSNSNLISKVYFPRLIMPVSAVVVGFVEFALSFVILAGLMVYYQYVPTWRLLVLPVFIGIGFLAAFGPALWIGALNVKYRDFAQITPFIIQFGLYVSPVGFTSEYVREHFPGTLGFLYSINPMVGVIDGFRWAICGQQFNLYWPGFILSLVVIAVILVTGISYFRKVEKTFADVI